jgi:ParB family chromosome partitioning protein
MTAVVMEIELDKCRTSRFNARKNQGDLSELTESIISIGVLELPQVRLRGDGYYEVIAGGRRVEAARKAGLKTITVVVVEVSDTEALLRSLIENVHRKDLSLEER